MSGSNGPWALGLLVFGVVMMGVTYALLQLQRWAYITIAVVSVPLFFLSLHLDFWPLLLPFVLLLPRSYRNFYGKRRRFVPTWEACSANQHAHSAESYKQRGMGYMALQEWAAAIRQEPHNMRYRLALGTAYVRLKQFDQALAELKAVLQSRPDDPQLQALVEKVASYAQEQKKSC